MDLGSKIKEFFKSGSFGSVEKFAELSGVHRATIYGYFNNEIKPGPDVLAKWMGLGCDLNWLLADDAGPPGVKEPKADYKTKLEEENKALKTENENLRSEIGRIYTITQAIKLDDKLKGKKK